MTKIWDQFKRGSKGTSTEPFSLYGEKMQKAMKELARLAEVNADTHRLLEILISNASKPKTTFKDKLFYNTNASLLQGDLIKAKNLEAGVFNLNGQLKRMKLTHDDKQHDATLSEKDFVHNFKEIYIGLYTSHGAAKSTWNQMSKDFDYKKSKKVIENISVCDAHINNLQQSLADLVNYIKPGCKGPSAPAP